jgi:hypothetical protein
MANPLSYAIAPVFFPLSFPFPFLLTVLSSNVVVENLIPAWELLLSWSRLQTLS